MDRHFQCHCGGTAWVDRQDGLLTIHCAKCGATVSGNTLSECRADWRLRHGPGRRTETGNVKRAAGKPPGHPL